MKKQNTPTVGIIAPASPAPQVELFQGAERLLQSGFEVWLHPQVKKQKDFYAGSDTDRALALLDYAYDEDTHVILAARGGYGCIRLLPMLNEMTKQVGKPPKKTLIGFSDVTVLLEYARKHWGWRVIHGPMPATQHFERVKGKDYKEYIDLIQNPKLSQKFKLKSLYWPKKITEIKGTLVGGNLAGIAAALKTPFEFDLKGKILFLEDITESAYRLDRLMQQLYLSGALNGVRAIVLGTLTDCHDSVVMVYAQKSKGAKKVPLKPLRPKMSDRRVLEAVFVELAEKLNVPLMVGLNVGHGDGTRAIELGRTSVLSKKDSTLLIK